MHALHDCHTPQMVGQTCSSWAKKHFYMAIPLVSMGKGKKAHLQSTATSIPIISSNWHFTAATKKAKNLFLISEASLLSKFAIQKWWFCELKFSLYSIVRSPEGMKLLTWGCSSDIMEIGLHDETTKLLAMVGFSSNMFVMNKAFNRLQSSIFHPKRDHWNSGNGDNVI